MLLETNTVCGGNNVVGQLGTPDTSTNYRQVPLPAATVDLDVEWDSSCAVLATGQVYCWGSNQYGQLGNPVLTDTMTSTPQLVYLTAGAVATSVSVGINSTCVVLSTGAAYCWGKNDYGQLGTGNYTNSTSPQLLQMPSGESVTSMHAGNSHACAITVSEQLYCWGWNGYGQLGLDQLVNRNVPTLVSVPLNAGEKLVEVGVGTGETCVMTTSRTLCSGLNHKGQLGNGTTIDSRTFQEVVGFTEPSWRCADVTSATGQNFTGADFSYCDFTKVPGASFAGDTLVNANLSYANLSNLSLGGANISGANFDSSTAVGADFGGATFSSSTSMANTNLQNASVDRGRQIAGVPAVMPLYRTIQAGTFVSTDTRIVGPSLHGVSDTQTSYPMSLNPLRATVANSVDSLTVYVARWDPATQSLTFNGSSVADGSYTPVTLNVDTNTVTLVVTAEGGVTTETITITITRERTRCLQIPVRYIDLSDCDLRSRTDLACADFRNALRERVDL